MRQFQRYTVTIHRREISRFPVVQTNDLRYHPQLGLLVGQDAPSMPASAWVVSD